MSEISIDEKKIINDFSDIDEDNYSSHILKIISLWKIDNNKKYDFIVLGEAFNWKRLAYLILDNMTWCGSKSCKKKDLLSPQWLREVKDKKYPLWRIDTYFSKKKYNDIFFVNKGGWHFTNIKTPEEIDKKLRSYLHHPEYEKSKIGPKEISEMIKKKQPVYDLTVNSSETKDRSRSKLKISSLNELPIYIQQNKEKFNEWIVSN